MRRGWH